MLVSAWTGRWEDNLMLGSKAFSPVLNVTCSFTLCEGSAEGRLETKGHQGNKPKYAVQVQVCTGDCVTDPCAFQQVMCFDQPEAQQQLTVCWQVQGLVLLLHVSLCVCGAA